MASDRVSGENWASLEATLARRLDLEASALASRALVRRRGIDRAATQLRLALVYGGMDLSLRGTAFWAEAAGVAEVSDVALMYRLQGAEAWLAGLAQTLLGQEIGAWGGSLQVHGRRVRLVDGTSLMAAGLTGGRGGGHGRGYHLHACFDLAAQQFDEWVPTSARDAESLARHTAGPGEIFIAGDTRRKISRVSELLPETLVEGGQSWSRSTAKAAATGPSSRAACSVGSSTIAAATAAAPSPTRRGAANLRR